MPELFYPEKWIDSPYNIPWEDWYRRGVRGVIFDIDNTLVEDNAPANEKARGLFLRLKEIGIKPFLLSNNDRERVAPFAKAVGGCGYICKAGKPGPASYKKALEMMKTDRTNTVSVGDQIFTDTVGANQAGIYSVLVNPVGKKEVLQVRLKRLPEKPVLYFYKRHHDYPGKSLVKVRQHRMTVSGKTRVCGILAFPVGHTMSPLIQNYFASKAGVDLVYVPFKVEPEALGEAVRGLDALDILGANVTVPHKQAIIPYLKEIDDTAAAIGAVNTLVRVSGGYKGYNTDAEGFYMALQKYGVDISGKVCILIGAGGAARAAAFILAREGAKEIICLNRTAAHAEALMTDIRKHFPAVATKVLPLDGWRDIDRDGCLAIQTTNIGMTPETAASPIEDEEFFKGLSFAMDVIYTPSRTRFLKLAEKAGVPVGNGLHMLIFQGLAAFNLWNPEAAVPEEAIEGAGRKVTEFLEEGR